MTELNRVLGGGLTRGSVVLLAGDPGVGKSTLLLQLVGQISDQHPKGVLYVSGEESLTQLKQRGNRLGIGGDRLVVLAETNLMEILTHLEKTQPEVLVIDSVQTLFWPELTSIPGSVSQVREVADRLVRFAKARNVTVILVGHVTREGSIAGPMALEHLVDTVLFFEGEKGQSYRILRSTKNRFGPTNEIGVYDMHESGLREVENPSEFFLKDRPEGTPGTVVFPAMEGSRPLLVEVQGLAASSSYGVPLRNAIGFDKNRLTMLLAVLEKRAGMQLSDQDIYVNIVGGIRITETAVDLAVMAAVVSSFVGKRLPLKSIVFGEVGLTGEVRATSQGESRIREAEKLGFGRAILPANNEFEKTRLECHAIQNVNDLIDLIR